MVLSSPISWAAVYGAFYNWASQATGVTVRWADQNAPRPNFPYVLLDITSERKEGGIDEVEYSFDETRVRNVRITPIARNNTTYTVSINGTVFSYVSDADAIVAEVTAGLASAISAGAEPVTATDNGTSFDVVGDGEVLNPSVPRIFNIVLSDDFDGSLLSRVNKDIGNEVEIRVSGSREFTLNVQAFERNTPTDNPGSDPTRNAYNYLTVLQSSLGLPSVQELFRAVNVAFVEEMPILDLSEKVEDVIESRASMDIRARVLSVLHEYSGFISSVSGDGVLTGFTGAPDTVSYGT